MNRSLRTGIGVGIATIVVVAGVGALYWWSERATEPTRPASMPVDSTFVPGGASPLDFEPSGIWLHCDKEGVAEGIDCRITYANGDPIFRGTCRPPYGPNPPRPDDLVFDVRRSGSFWFKIPDGRLVPIIVLTNGQILLPTTGYEHSLEVVRRDAPGLWRNYFGPFEH